MKFVNIHDAKTHLSKYLEQVQKGQETIIICKNGQPIAQLIEYKGNTGLKIGLLKDKIQMGDDFDEMPDELKGYFE